MLNKESIEAAILESNQMLIRWSKTDKSEKNLKSKFHSFLKQCIINHSFISDYKERDICKSNIAFEVIFDGYKIKEIIPISPNTTRGSSFVQREFNEIIKSINLSELLNQNEISSDISSINFNTIKNIQF